MRLAPSPAAVALRPTASSMPQTACSHIIDRAANSQALAPLGMARLVIHQSRANRVFKCYTTLHHTRPGMRAMPVAHGDIYRPPLHCIPQLQAHPPPRPAPMQSAAPSGKAVRRRTQPHTTHHHAPHLTKTEPHSRSRQLTFRIHHPLTLADSVS